MQLYHSTKQDESQKHEKQRNMKNIEKRAKSFNLQSGLKGNEKLRKMSKNQQSMKNIEKIRKCHIVISQKCQKHEK